MFANALKFFVLLAGFATAFGDNATWQSTAVTKVTSLFGVYATNANEVYGAVLDNALGAGLVHSADYGATSDFTGPLGAMNMDVAVTSNGQIGSVVGVGGIFYGPVNSASYTKVNLHTITQNVESIYPNGLGAAGQFSAGVLAPAANGVAVTLDGGNTWNTYDIGLTSGYSARYASFPTQSTWYVTSGMWPSAQLTATKDTKQISKKLFMNEKNHVEYVNRNLRGGDETGYYGAISKTTDGGKTWSKVYDAEGVFYPNAISCFDEANCVAVGENDSGYIVGTHDGGATWSTMYVADGISLLAAKMVSPTEAWAAGGTQNAKRQMIGYYYHTVDGGATWEVLTSTSGYVADLSFSNGVGYSAVMTSSYSSIAVYK